MIKKIPRFEIHANGLLKSGSSLDCLAEMRALTEAQKQYDRHYFEHVEPLNKAIDKAAVVYFNGNEIDDGHPSWFKFYSDCTHQGLLIGVEEIKKDTAEDILRDWSKWIESEVDIFKPMSGKAAEFYKRAKALLEKSEEL